jgi:hypothetical protein
MGKSPAPEDFVHALAPALRQAASIARTLEGRVANRPKPREVNPVKAALTIADTAVQEALLARLFEHFPHVRLEAEEDTVSVARFSGESDALVVIDPIDGTLRFFLEGRGPYGVMVGLVVRNQYQAVLVATPREGLFFDAVRGGGARVAAGDTPPRRARVEAGGRRILVSHDLPEVAAERLRSGGFEVAPACGGAVSVAPLLPGVSGGLRLGGRDSRGVSIRGRIGALISAEAGALVRSETGDAFPQEIEAPARGLLVAATREELRALEAAAAAAL